LKRKGKGKGKGNGKEKKNIEQGTFTCGETYR
jgi:hypothetical protein